MHVRSRFTVLQIILGEDLPCSKKKKKSEDSPIPKCTCLKIRSRDGVESLTTLEDGEFKVPIDGYINKSSWCPFGPACGITLSYPLD